MQSKLTTALRKKFSVDDTFDDISEDIEAVVENTLFKHGVPIEVASLIAREVTAKAEDQLRTSMVQRNLL